MFTPTNNGRLALSTIVAILGFIALNQACNLLPDVLIWWLIYTIGSGVVLNADDTIQPGTLALLAVWPAFVPVIVLGFFLLAGMNLCLSLPTPWIGMLLPPVSWFAIFIFSFARKPLRAMFESAGDKKTEEQIKRAISVVQIVIGGIIAIALALSGLGSRDEKPAKAAATNHRIQSDGHTVSRKG
ncbi:MAG TPA: hypothetical protein VHO24_21140 [Opitutaceae bacterium]|nr:hypothetical protein [Opitutaceae bacterium]